MKEINEHISVDCVVFHCTGSRMEVLLVDRARVHTAGEKLDSGYSLPGNHVYENEEAEEAAIRILREVSGVHHVRLTQFGAFGSPGRLKGLSGNRNRVITVAYFTLMNPEEVRKTQLKPGSGWHDTESVKNMEIVLDHSNIILTAMESIKERVFVHPEMVFELLPKKFTLTQLQGVYEAILGVRYDKRNFRKKTARMKYLIALDEKQSGVNHKPGRLYMFSRDVYQETRKDLFIFNI